MSDIQENKGIELSRDQYRRLVILARMALHTAYVWNDHNFNDKPEVMCRITARGVGINTFDDANDFIASLPLQNIEG